MPPSRPGQRANRFAVPPLVHRPLTETASRRAITRQRGNGRSRSTPTGPKAVGVPAPRCIRRRPLSPFHRPGALYAASWRVLLLFLAVYVGDYIRSAAKCQGRAANSARRRHPPPQEGLPAAVSGPGDGPAAGSAGPVLVQRPSPFPQPRNSAAHSPRPSATPSTQSPRLSAM